MGFTCSARKRHGGGQGSEYAAGLQPLCLATSHNARCLLDQKFNFSLHI
jgi:hypothetical protein